MIQTDSVVRLLPFSDKLGFTLYKDTGDGRAAIHQLYIYAMTWSQVRYNMQISFKK